MRKAFWQGFREGFLKYSWVGIALGLGIGLGNQNMMLLESLEAITEDISECVLIKENE